MHFPWESFAIQYFDLGISSRRRTLHIESYKSYKSRLPESAVCREPTSPRRTWTLGCDTDVARCNNARGDMTYIGVHTMSAILIGLLAIT